jgi:hypothetical protein
MESLKHLSHSRISCLNSVEDISKLDQNVNEDLTTVALGT